MNEKSRRRISFSDLGKILQEVNEKSYIEKTSTKSSWDFTLAIPFLKENGLDENICFRSFDKGLPLNSERKIYTRLANILIRNLTIKSDDALNWGKQSDWIAFSLRPISQIHLYAGSLEAVCGDEYKCLPLRSKNWLSFIGLLQMIWIAVWGFAFSKSIKR